MECSACLCSAQSNISYISMTLFQVFDQCSTLQRELSSTVHEMAKSHKVYSEDEHLAHEAREKASDAESK